MILEKHKRCPEFIKESGKNIYNYARYCHECGVSAYSTRIEGDSDGRFLCGKHKHHIVRHKKIKNRSIYDKNEIRYDYENGIAYVIVYDAKTSEENGMAIIDIEDVDKVKNIKWRMDCHGYIVASGKTMVTHTLQMHRLILGLENVKAPIVDHVSQVKHDNRKSNLREVNYKQNVYNTGLRVTNKSGVKGVRFDERGFYDARFEMNYKETYFREYFDKFDDAVKWRISLESKYFKEFSAYHNPQSGTIQLTYHSHDDNKQTFIECNLQGEITKFEKLS